MPLSPNNVNEVAGSYRFGADFYQPNATLLVTLEGGDLVLHWPDGSASVLMPSTEDHFMDRTYWTGVSARRGADGQVDALIYDDFTGIRVPTR